MRLRRARAEQLKAHEQVKWPHCGHLGWWRVERIDGRFVRIERGGISQYVPAAALKVAA